MTDNSGVDEDTFLAAIVERLQGVKGIEAVVLGGSRARGTATASSDYDLGIYYDPAAGLDRAALDRAAAELDDSHQAGKITPLGEWGPWINGGGWLKIGGQAVDFLYRDLEKVRRVIADCRDGKLEVAYQPGHPFGFVSSIYLSEMALCRPLWDPHGVARELKGWVEPYPAGLKRGLIERFWWEVDFALQNARKPAVRGDSAYVAGCCWRAAGCLAIVLFALNEQHWMNEKGAVALAGKLARSPARFQERVEGAFARLTGQAGELSAAIDLLEELKTETAPLVEETRAS